MQKKLIALAVAGLVSGGAFAQTNVTISGRLAAGFEQYKLGDVAAGHSTENRVSDQSSRVIFNIKEDLGSGLSAVGQVDMRLSLDTGGRQMLNNTGAANAVGFFPGGIAGGNSWLGLSSATLGTFVVGRNDLHYDTFGAIDSTRAGGLGNNLAIGMMSAVSGLPIANWTRSDNVVMWNSPNWSGFNVRVAHSTYPGSSTGTPNEGSGTLMTDPSSGGAWTTRVAYANGPIQAGLSYWKKDEENTRKALAAGGFDERGTKVYAAYTFPMGFKIGLGWDKSKVQTYAVNATAGWTDRTAWILPMSYTMGAHAFYATYAKTGDLKGAGAASSSDAKGYMLGYDYALSKRSSVGVYYTKLTNNTNATYSLFQVSNTSGGYNGATGPAAGNDPSSLYFGMAHNF